MKRNCFVNWEIDVDAENALEAAQAALKVQRDPASIATVFQVYVPNEEAGRLGKWFTVDTLLETVEEN